MGSSANSGQFGSVAQSWRKDHARLYEGWAYIYCPSPTAGPSYGTSKPIVANGYRPNAVKRHQVKS